MVEQAVILVTSSVLGNPRISSGTYSSLDLLASRGQCGFLSTFTDCSDPVIQLIGTNYHTPEKLTAELGPIKLSVLKRNSAYSDFGDISDITDLTPPEIFAHIQEKLSIFNVIVVEVINLTNLETIVGLLFPGIDNANVAVAIVLGYIDGATVPKFPIAPVVDPSWKVIGPNVVETLDIKKPFLYISASHKLTRIDKVQAFDEDDIEKNNGMGAMPICQLIREYSYYTGSSWKYGA
jgi:hypothetical protein